MLIRLIFKQNDKFKITLSFKLVDVFLLNTTLENY